MRYLFLMLVLVSSLTGQTTWYVQGQGQPGGSGTPADPFGSIQQGIDAAGPANLLETDTVLVAPGVYLEQLDFGTQEVRVVSSGGPEATIIDGGHAGSVVTIAGGQSHLTRLEGFTITGGWALGEGGGVECQSAAPTIVDCIITGNTSFPDGGGVRVENGAPWLLQCVLSGNLGLQRGGGLFAQDSQVLLQGSVISGNMCTFPGGGLHTVGGMTSLSGCTLSANRAATGGAWAVLGPASAIDSIFWGNSSGISDNGGLLAISFSDVQPGSGLGQPGNLSLDPLFVQPIFWGSAPTGAGDFHLGSASPVLGAASNGSDPGALPGSHGFMVFMSQADPTSLQILQQGGPPGAPSFLALSFDPTNAGGGLGSGWWGGLHLGLGTFLAELFSAAPPFQMVLDGQGEALFELPPGSLPPALSGLQVWFVAHAFPLAGGQPVVSLPASHVFL